METQDTTMISRAKNLASSPSVKKSITIGGLSGGVSSATIILCYQLFVTSSTHRADMSLHWQEIQERQAEVKLLRTDLETTRINLARMELVKGQLDTFIAQQSERDKAQWNVIAKKQDKP